MQGGKKYYQKETQKIIHNHRWCFIVGCNNSGTSLLHSMLKNTGQVSTHDREGQFYTNVLTRGRRRGYERVWTEFISEVAMNKTHSASCVPRLLHDWMLSIQQPMKDLFVDKTTLNAVRMRWLQENFPNSYFIGVVRNGFAVVEGIKRKGKKDVIRGAKHWNLVNKIMIDDSKKINRFLLVKYEQLVGEQKSTAKRIANFLGMEKETLMNTLDAKFKFETLAGKNPQKIRNFNQSSIDLLSEEELEIVRSTAAEMIELFEYEI